LDGQQPNAIEKKQILAGLTIAAVVTTSNPAKVTVSRSVHKARATPADPTPISGVVGDTSTEKLVIGDAVVKKKKKVKKEGDKERKKKTGIETVEIESQHEKTATSMEETVESPSPLLELPKSESSEIPSEESPMQPTSAPNDIREVSTTADAIPIKSEHPSSTNIEPTQRQSFESSSYQRSLTELSFVDAPQEFPPSEQPAATEPTAVAVTEAFNKVPLSPQQDDISSSVSVSPARSTLSDALAKADELMPQEPSNRNPPIQSEPSTSAPHSEILSQTPSRSRFGRLAQLEDKIISPSAESENVEDADDLLLNRVGRKGSKISTPSRKGSLQSNLAKTRDNMSSSPHRGSPIESMLAKSMNSSSPARAIPMIPRGSHTSSPVTSPKQQSALSSTPPARAMSPSEFKVTDMKADKGEAWFKKLAELQAKEKRAREAQTAAELAAAKAKEAAMLAAKAAEDAERVTHEDDFGSSHQSHVQSSTSARLTSTSPNTTAGYLEPLGPYRRVYNFEQRGVAGPSPPMGPRSGTHDSRPVVVSFAQGSAASHNGTLPQSPTSINAAFMKRTVVGADVERGSSTDFRGVSLKTGRSNSIGGSKASEVLPPLFIRPSTGTHGTSSFSVPYYTHKNSHYGDENTLHESTEEAKMEMAATLVLSRPITANASYRRPRDGSVSSKSESLSVYSGIHMTSNGHQRSLMGKAVSLFSGDGGMSVFSGIAGTSSRAPSAYGKQSILSATSQLSSEQLAQLQPLMSPQAPTIPYMSMNNSLQLFLKFRVFPRDSEKIQAWVPCSVVGQLPLYVHNIPGVSLSSTSASKLGKVLLETLQGKSSGPQLERLKPIERAVYILLTDRALYFFTPVFRMPHNPLDSIRGSFGAAPAVSSHLADIISQVRYDDPGKWLRLARRVPLRSLLRIDVGPNRQYLSVHFKEEVAINGASQSKVGVEGLSGTLTPGETPPLSRKSTGSGVDLGIKSLVLLTRDRASTSQIIDTLVPALYESAEGPDNEFKAGILKFKGPDGKIKLVNQDVEWSLQAWRDRVLLRQGPKDVVWNQLEVPNEDWRDAVFKNPDGNSARSNGSGWLGGLINNLVPSAPVAQDLPKQAPGTPPETESTANESVSQHPREKSNIIKKEDHDPAVSDDYVLSKVDFEFLKLYLLVGYIVPKIPTLRSSLSPINLASPSSLSIDVHSLTLTATTEYIYLAAERLDVWPPPLFPPEFNPAESVNKPFLDALEKANALSSQTAAAPNANSDPFKGLTVDRVPQWSPPLRVGRVKDLVRCERWRTWRWALGPVTQMGEASELEKAIAVKVQNGAIGEVSVGKKQQHQLQQPGSQRRSKFDGDIGNTSGWGWWVRVVFAVHDDDDVKGKQKVGEEKLSDTETRPQQEYWWDLVFATISAANEFLEYVRDARGVKMDDDVSSLPIHDRADVYDPYSGNGEFSHEVDADMEEHEEGEEEDGAGRDLKLLKRLRPDGVAFVIGDD
jgi:hypothetical protein